MVSGGTGLYLRAALADLDVPRPWRPEIARGSRVRWTTTGSPPTSGLPASIPPRPRSSTGTTADGSSARSSSRRPARRSSPVATGSGGAAPGARRWSRASTSPADVLERRIRERAEAMFARGVVDEVRAALAGHVSRTAEKTLGLAEIAELGWDALEPLVVRTRRYAAYQRKWMRRIPDLVRFDGDRSPDEVAEEIVARVRGGHPSGP